MTRRGGVLSEEKRQQLAAEVVGMTLTRAGQHVEPYGLVVEDRSSPGWYTQPDLPHRIVVVLAADGTVASSTAG